MKAAKRPDKHQVTVPVSEVSAEFPQFPSAKVIHIMLMGIGFPLEGNPPVGSIAVLQPDQPEIVFSQVKNIEENDEQFRLLPEMNFFMIDEYRIFLIFGVPDEDEGKKRNAADF